jgi:tetrahydromethanopterin S-methyltransferase subunit G
MILGKMEMNAIRQGQAPTAGEGIAKAGFYIGLVVTILYGLGILAYLFLIVLGLAAASIQ